MFDKIEILPLSTISEDDEKELKTLFFSNGEMVMKTWFASPKENILLQQWESGFAKKNQNYEIVIARKNKAIVAFLLLMDVVKGVKKENLRKVSYFCFQSKYLAIPFLKAASIMLDKDVTYYSYVHKNFQDVIEMHEVIKFLFIHSLLIYISPSLVAGS